MKKFLFSVLAVAVLYGSWIFTRETLAGEEGSNSEELLAYEIDIMVSEADGCDEKKITAELEPVFHEKEKASQWQMIFLGCQIKSKTTIADGGKEVFSCPGRVRVKCQMLKTID